MEVSKHVVSNDSAGLRLDRFVAAVEAELSRSRAARLIRAGRVTVNRAPADPDRRLASGDRVTIQVPPVDAELTADAGALDVMLETEDFVAVNKPPGLIMHPGAGHEAGTLAHRLIARYPEMHEIGHPRRPGIVHRLDKDTSGVVVVARTSRGYSHLTRAFAARRVTKQYLLLARGRPTPSVGEIEAPIGRHPDRRTRMAVTRRGRPAVTAYEVLSSADRATLVLARPATGRTHQIRVHMAAIGHVILGDATYGSGPGDAPRPMLHAWTLEFTGPAGKGWRIAAAPPADFGVKASALELTVPETPQSGSR